MCNLIKAILIMKIITEVVEMMTKRRVDLCCLQETRWTNGYVIGKLVRKDFFLKQLNSLEMTRAHG